MNTENVQIFANLIAGSVSIFISYLVIASAFIGIGVFLRRCCGLTQLNIDDLFLTFWIGFCTTILFLLFWNFVFPITGIASAVILIAGGFGLLVSREEISSILHKEPLLTSFNFVIVVICTGFWVANLSIGGLDYWDSSLYHMQAIKWIKEYPAVPGLGNLHGPLAFNNSTFLYDAMLDTGIWKGHAIHLGRGLLVFVMLVQGIAGGFRLFGFTSQPCSTHYFNFATIGPVLYLAIDPSTDGHQLPSYSTDLPTNLILLIITSQFYCFCFKGCKISQVQSRYRVICLAMLLATAVCFKLSSAVYAVTCFIVIGAIWLRQNPTMHEYVIKGLSVAAVIASVFALALISRGIILSGYPFFPVAVAGIPVEWRVPIEHANAELAFVEYSTLLGIGSDIHRLLHRVLFVMYWEIIVPLGIAIFGSIVFLYKQKDLAVRKGTLQGWWVALPIVIALITWSLIGPEPRYSFAWFWCLAILSLSQVYSIASNRFSTTNRILLLMVVCIASFPTVVKPLMRSDGAKISGFRSILRTNFNKPLPELWFDPPSGTYSISRFETVSGLILNVPRIKCWDAPLPCTPNPAPNLRLRQVGDMRSGFMVDGDWNMQDWPYSWRQKFAKQWRNRIQ